MTGDHIHNFIEWLRANGIPPANPREIIADDRRRRYDVAGDSRGSKNGSYQLAIAGDFAFGRARDFKRDLSFSYSSKKKEELTPAQRTALAEQSEARRRAAAQERIRTHSEVAVLARRMWQEGLDGTECAHAYAIKKNISLDGLRVRQGEILVPLVDTDKKLWNLQKIDRAGSKKFMPGGRVSGLYHPVGKRPAFKDKPFIFTEGLATGKTINRILECPVICTMTAGNLLATARAFREKHYYARFIFAADNDAWTPGRELQKWLGDRDHKKIPGDDDLWRQWREKGMLSDTGLEKATIAAKLTGGIVVTLPEVYKSAAQKPTDFNDMAALSGGNAVYDVFKDKI